MADEQDMTDFFNDPEVRAAMAAAGAVHKPGMAKELMADLAPLLAEEGVDVDNLGDTDLDTLNAAMARATAQYNLELFTPTGERRTQSLAVLRQFSEALDAGHDEFALAILTAIQPEPTDTLPAVSHVIGVGIGLLDSWFTNRKLRPILDHPRIPPWHLPARAAARAAISLAREGRAFDSIDYLIARYTGLPALDGTALAVAASLKSIAASRGTDIGQTFDDLLTEDAHAPATQSPIPSSYGRTSSTQRSKKRNNHVSGHPGRRDQPRADYSAVRNFSAWLSDEETMAAPGIEEEMTMFGGLLNTARQIGINVHTPAGLERLVDEICIMAEDGHFDFALAALATLDDYVHFHIHTSTDQSGWAEAHEEVVLATNEIDPGTNTLEEVIETADQIDPAELREAYAKTMVAAMVPTLLEWIGRGRRTTGTGSVRRADIQEVAAMLGFSAVGVAKLPEYEPHTPPLFGDDHSSLPSTIPALSMLDVPLLTPWWSALRVCEVIQTTSTMVRPGPAAADWLAEEVPPLELMEKVISVFIAEMLLEELRGGDWYEEQIIAITVGRLVRALTPESASTAEASAMDMIVKPRVMNKLHLLEHVGLLELSGDECVIAPDLRGVVARGLLVTSALIEQLTGGEPR